MKKNRVILFISLFISMFTLSEQIKVNVETNDELSDYIKRYANPVNIQIFKDLKSSYIFEETNIDDILDNADYLIEDDYFRDQEDIDKKLDELIKTKANSFEAINNEIIIGELTKVYNEWKGVKYEWGGDSHRGIDCSALVRRIYRKVFNYELPRVSTSQIKKGYKIKKSELKPGDLIFFRPGNSSNHTAVYLGNSLFIHSGSSTGVIIASLDNSYWKRYFKFGVRVTGLNLSE